MTEPRPAPSTLELIDPVQEGAPRIIHPIGSEPLAVGTPLAYQEDSIAMDRPETYHIVKKTEVKPSRNGKSFVQFIEGTSVPAHVAYEYGLLDAQPNLSARPAEEQRSQGAAPENRMELAPENRGEGDENLTPQQKAARTRAANQAAQQAAENADAEQIDDGEAE